MESGLLLRALVPMSTRLKFSFPNSKTRTGDRIIPVFALSSRRSILKIFSLFVKVSTRKAGTMKSCARLH
ncbi:hypothetical protein CVT24_002633, partial [Panaeolus cyanescens]